MKFQQWLDCGLLHLLFVANVSCNSQYLFVSNFPCRVKASVRCFPSNAGHTVSMAYTAAKGLCPRFQHEQMFKQWPGLCWSTALAKPWLSSSVTWGVSDLFSKELHHWRFFPSSQELQRLRGKMSRILQWSTLKSNDSQATRGRSLRETPEIQAENAEGYSDSVLAALLIGQGPLPEGRWQTAKGS